MTGLKRALQEINWEMALSHHPKDLYEERVLWVGNAPLCARCLAIWLSALICGLLMGYGFLGISFVGAVLLGLPAEIDFISHEVGLRKSKLWIRMMTGAFFGYPVALFFLSGFTFHWIGLFGLGTYFALLQLVAAFAMMKSGKLQSYLKAYEGSVRT